jgi:hypothetical protein
MIASPAQRLPVRGAARDELGRRLKQPWIDFVGQQAVWWSSVGLVRVGAGSLAALPALLWISLAVWGWGSHALRLALLGAALGIAVDGSLIHFGFITLGGPLDLGVTASFMVGLWASFALSFASSLRWPLARGSVFALLLGGPAGLLAYRAGERLGVLQQVPPLTSFASLALGWALAVLALQHGARRILGEDAVRAQAGFD